MASPLAQFEIKKIIEMEALGYDISFTNSSLAMVMTVVFISLFMYLGLRNLEIIPSKKQSVVESSYEFIYGMIGDNIGSEGMKYFSFIFTVAFVSCQGNDYVLIAPSLQFLHPALCAIERISFCYVKNHYCSSSPTIIHRSKTSIALLSGCIL